MAWWAAPVLGILGAATAAAAPAPILNPGFEALYLGSNLPAEYAGDVPAGAFPVGPPPSGWTAYYEGGSPIGGAFIGVLNPGTAADHDPAPAYFPAGAPEGDNAVLLYMDGDTGANEFGVEQVLPTTLQANRTYTLTAEVGNIASGAGLVVPFTAFFDLAGFPGYRVQLLAGGVVVAEDTATLDPAEGVFETATVQLTTGDAPAQLGQPLAIRLVNRNEPDVAGVSGLEVDFDDVRLDVSLATPAVPIAPVFRWLLVGALLCIAALALPRRIAASARPAAGA